MTVIYFNWDISRWNFRNDSWVLEISCLLASSQCLGLEHHRMLQKITLPLSEESFISHNILHILLMFYICNYLSLSTKNCATLIMLHLCYYQHCIIHCNATNFSTALQLISCCCYWCNWNQISESTMPLYCYCLLSLWLLLAFMLSLSLSLL